MSGSAQDTLLKALTALQENPENPEAAISGFEDEAVELRRRADSLDQIASGIRGLLGKPSAPVVIDAAAAASAGMALVAAGERSKPATRPDDAPEGMEAIRRIMRAGGIWTVAEIFTELKRRGWESKESKDPIRPTEAAVNRLWKVKHEVERVGRGKYRYVGDRSPEVDADVGAEPPTVVDPADEPADVRGLSILMTGMGES